MKKVVVIALLLVLLQVSIVPAASAAPPPSNGVWHCVTWGETLSSIGRRYGVSAWSICSANGLANCNCIYAGQYLWIPYDYGYYRQPCDSCGPYYGGSRVHIVRWGETLSSISRWYGVSPWSIAQANGIYNMNYIYAGQRLYIP